MIEKLYKVGKIYFVSFFVFFLFVFLCNILFNNFIDVNIIRSFFVLSFFIGRIIVDKDWKNLIITIISLLLISLIGFLIFYFIWDASVDGNTYHIQVIFDLFAGKNLFLSELTSEWLNYYPKTIEILFSGFGSFFHNYDMGRIIKLFLILISFSNILYFIKQTEGKFNFWKILIALIVVLNPVVLSQFFTFYIDDVLYLFLLNFVIYFLLGETKIGLLIFSLMISAKLSYCCFGILAIPFMLIILSIYKKQSIRSTIKICYIGFSKKQCLRILFLLFIAIIGGHQYLINTFRFHNPLYGFYGSEKKDIISMFQPSNFENKNKISKFIYTYFSYSRNYCISDDCQKFIRESKGMPKEFYNSYSALTFPDPNLNGFGNIFTILLLLSLAIIPCFLLMIKKKNNCEKIYGIALLYIILCIALLPFPWARYLPIIYYLPLFIILFFKKENFYFGKILLLLYVLNLIIIFFFIGKFALNRGMAKIRQQNFINNIGYISEVYYDKQYQESFLDKKYLGFYSKNIGDAIVEEKDSDAIYSICGINSYDSVLDSYNLILSCDNGGYLMLSDYGNSISDYFYIK